MFCNIVELGVLRDVVVSSGYDWGWGETNEWFECFISEYWVKGMAHTIAQV